MKDQQRQIAMASVLSVLVFTSQSSAFAPPPISNAQCTRSSTQLHHWANRLDSRFENIDETLYSNPTSSEPQPPLTDNEFPDQEQSATRRSLLSIGFVSTILSTIPMPANADFAPGGTLLDRTVSVTYGNPEASPSRRADNSNVLFSQDNYYKFGAAAQWIEPGSSEFPKTVPFSPSQQRYDALKKYGARANSSAGEIAKLGAALEGDVSASQIAGADDPSYGLRALGLLANSFLASENTGVSNELMLARWYINEMYLRIGDIRNALEKGDSSEAKTCYGYLKKAMNSYLTLMNRVITSKVGDKFGYLQ